MIHNDVLRSLRYLLNVRDQVLIDILELGGYLVTEEEIITYLKAEDEPGFVRCPDEVMSRFLNGLVIFKRGKDESRPAPPIELPVTNNTVLKKLRVAFELKDTDIIALIEKPGALKISKAELGAFFRSRDHRNFRECGDQYLRNLLKGLTP
jgi:uncharacterized protein YehS (DUF1456 family)